MSTDETRPGDGRAETTEDQNARRLVIADEDLRTEELPPVGASEPELEISLKKEAAPAPPVVPPSAKTPIVQAPATAAEAAVRPAASPAPPAAEQSWFGRHSGRIMIASGALVALAVGFIVAFVVLDVFNSDRERITDALVTAEAVFSEPTSSARQARIRRQDRLPAVRASATEAGRKADEIAAKADELRGAVSDGAVANPALALLDAEERFLRELAKAAQLQERNLDDWQDIRPGLERARAEIVAARREVEALKLETTEPLAPEAQDVDEAIASIDEVVTEGARVLKRWERTRRRALAARNQASAYRGQMAGLIQQYFDQRDVTRAFTQQEGTDFITARDTLLEHAAARDGIISRMQALPVPPEARAAHNAMVQLCTESRALLIQAAQDAEEDGLSFAFDDFEDDSAFEWPGSPGYERLLASSDQITNRFGPSRQAVLAAADRAIAKARIPRKPRI
jgi:hypothetical protein